MGSSVLVLLLVNLFVPMTMSLIQWVLNLAGLLLLDTVERHQTLVFSPRNLVQKWLLWPTLVVIKLKLIPMEESKLMEMESASQKEKNMFIVNLVLKSSKFSNGELASMSTLSCVFGYLQIPIMYKFYQLPLQEETNVVCVVISIEINSMNIWARMALLWHLAVVIKLLNGSGSAKISMLVFWLLCFVCFTCVSVETKNTDQSI